MLNIFYGRENLNKTKFIFDKVRGKTLLLVPDQFSLQAERDAFFYLNKKSLIDMDVVTFSRLGNMIVSKVGGRANLIGKEGRHMLLGKIIRENQERLELFRGTSEKAAFIDMMHDLISEFKQQNIDVEKLRMIHGEMPHDGILEKKLREVLLVFEEYENKIDGKYMDNEDFISMFVSKIEKAEFIGESDIWIYGFDSFTAKNLDVIYELAKHGKSVNVVLTLDDDSRDQNIFLNSKKTIEKIKNHIADVSTTKISEEYIEYRNVDMRHLDGELFSEPSKKKKTEGHIRLVRASNHYSEAATCAQFVLSLVRDKGYRYSEIAIICNDIDNKGELYKRVFSEYGINLFLDSKRDVKHHPAVNYILSLLNILDKNFKSEDVIKYLKTGFSFENDEDIEDIEIYVQKYRIDGKAWKKTFNKGVSENGEEEILRLESLRKEIVEPLLDFNELFIKEKTVKGKVIALYNYLENKVRLPEKIEKLVKQQEGDGYLEIAEETAQIWNTLTNLLEQMVEILGETRISKKDFALLLKSGFEAVEIGIIPPSVDGLIMGSMQRTRRGRIRATVVVCAEAGLLPAENKNIGILTEEERELLCSNDMDVCKSPKLQSGEEALAIYRNISKTEENLYMSYSASDDEGGTLEPSNIYLKIKEIFLGQKQEEDIFKKGNTAELVGGLDATKNNLISQIANITMGEEVDDTWKEVYKWFIENSDIDKLASDVLNKFGEENITEEEVNRLFKKEVGDILTLSPSRLEKFGSCPFAHFIAYGLSPEENEEYVIGAKEAGTIYHQCLMGISKELNEKKSWMTVSKPEVEMKIERLLEGINEKFKERTLTDGDEARYKAERIKTVCIDTAWMVIEHVRKGNIIDMQFEVSFGRGKTLPAIDISDGKVLLEGQIDRWDVLRGNYSKVIDYKSGKNAYSEKEAKAGVKLQLFIYLMATLNQNIKPGGAFYFHIDEASSKNNMDIQGEIEKQYKMDGFVLNNENVISGIDDTLGKKTNVFTSSPRTLLDEEVFHQLLEDVNGKIHNMAREIVEGEIGIKPKKIKERTSCTYCPYKGICKFDLSIEGCRYNMV